jgi:ZIP family zinc transporter
MAILLAAVTALATMAGGFLAFRARDRMHLVLGLSGGLLLGLVVFDLIPEVFGGTTPELFHVPIAAIALVSGYMALHVLERAFGSHEPLHTEHQHGAHEHHGASGLVGAIGLIVHVFLDGMAIGLSFRVSTNLGIAVTIAVIAHAFSDGLNTVALLIRNNQWQRRAYLLLGSDALSRISGAALGTYITIDNELVNIYLAVFAGFLIYLATSHILPEAHSDHPSRLTLIATFVGLIFMFAIVVVGHSAH